MFQVRPKHVLLAILMEVFALVVYSPGFAEGMMRHSAAAPRSRVEEVSNVVGYILHFPTVLLTILSEELIIFVPITQIIFWTFLFAYIGSRLRNPEE